MFPLSKAQVRTIIVSSTATSKIIIIVLLSLDERNLFVLFPIYLFVHPSKHVISLHYILYMLYSFKIMLSFC